MQCSFQEAHRARNPEYRYWSDLVVTEIHHGLPAGVAKYTCKDSDGREGGFHEHNLSLRDTPKAEERRGQPKAKPARDYVADHARRTLRKLGLAKDEAYNVVAALQLKGSADSSFDEGPRLADGRFDISKLSRGLPEGMTLGQVLGRTFYWYASAKTLGLPEKYFSEVHRRHADYGNDAARGKEAA